jgi:hypothetical protein
LVAATDRLGDIRRRLLGWRERDRTDSNVLAARVRGESRLRDRVETLGAVDDPNAQGQLAGRPEFPERARGERGGGRVVNSRDSPSVRVGDRRREDLARLARVRLVSRIPGGGRSFGIEKPASEGREIGVRVDEARQEDPPVEVDDGRVDPREELDVVARAETHDLAVANRERLVGSIRIGERVDLAVEQDEVRGVGHVRSSGADRVNCSGAGRST